MGCAKGVDVRRPVPSIAGIGSSQSFDGFFAIHATAQSGVWWPNPPCDADSNRDDASSVRADDAVELPQSGPHLPRLCRAETEHEPRS
jgi:hypothetical protein